MATYRVVQLHQINSRDGVRDGWTVERHMRRLYSRSEASLLSSDAQVRRQRLLLSFCGPSLARPTTTTSEIAMLAS